MNQFPFLAAIVMMGVAFSASFAVRRFRNRAGRGRARDESRGWDQIIASIRLRLPAGAEVVVLEHQMYFNDPRNRAAAIEVFTKNGFAATTAETYEKRTKYWLLAVRATMIERVQQELQRVHEFTNAYGGRYDRCNPQL
ncbi:MAG: ribonuclease E inhibitor RraB [Vulcanimicrobiaceae bacterium]